MSGHVMVCARRSRVIDYRRRLRVALCGQASTGERGVASRSARTRINRVLMNYRACALRSLVGVA